MDKQDLLIEIGTEELPPKALSGLSEAFAAAMAQQLEKAGLVSGTIACFATPRRLALLVSNLPLQQTDSLQEKLGPALQAAFSADGKATKAAEGFARSCGVDVAVLEQKTEGNVTRLVYRSQRKGETTATLLPGMLENALAALPVQRRMRWGSSRDEFVRPVHWLVLLHGSTVIPATLMGVTSGADTRGHRVHHPDPIRLNAPADYEDALHRGHVIASFDKRRQMVREQVEQEGRKFNANAIIDPALLDEVTALVEWPVALTGNFDQSFLSVPKEALISAMKVHQKCFHLLDATGEILPHFITLSNLVSRDPAQVIAGNEKVIRPRLADAAFFYEQDKKLSLISRIEKLKTVVFQQQLGTVHDKTRRVAQLAAHIARELGADTALAQRAAVLGKCDLLTSMVYEFAELQGTMGYYYACHDGEAPEVAVALKEQYLPRFAGDDLPASSTGMVLALAERLDTISGLFAIGQPPTGSRDPYALRRAALGILRIVVEQQLTLDLANCIRFSAQHFSHLPQGAGLARNVEDFIFERFRAWYADLGVSGDVFLAVDAVRPASPLEFDARVKAVNSFLALPQAQALAAANKRVSNILQKSELTADSKVHGELLKEAAEQVLAARLQSVKTAVEPLLKQRDFSAALAAMADLQDVVDSFFDQVMVNVEEDALRNNRLALLQQLRALFLLIADISLLQNV